ncbi:MAG TPA: DinB family protein [Thermomicrobiales bacterium]|nr:DinB family protein [Thermomicrobiales bacterium]
MQADNRPEPPFAAPPKEMVEAFLDYQRATLLWKIDGLSDEDLRRSFPPSTMTLLGMVKHLAYVERWWFGIVFAGVDLPDPWTKEDPDADWRVEPGETAASIVDFYKGEIERSRSIVAAAAWDDRAQRPGKEQTLGWILTHMVEEVARHNGHADIFRERIDGKTGE